MFQIYEKEQNTLMKISLGYFIYRINGKFIFLLNF